jgi:alkanesulfonate monooxygenase SsuD/methylene tetrahydromethanopterin reductase-like flavin-dependent oxidoreductase (luciferase family)
MKFGLLYELACPRPWDEDSEYRKFQEALAQIELADRLGFHAVWAVEHHYLEEYSHSSAPEVWLAAAAARTKSIRIGHGIVAVLPSYNHPSRVAERIGTLDLVSGGRVEFGVGETSSDAELRGFGIERAEKKAMAEEALPNILRLMVQEPFPGYEGQYFAIPQRNLVPKPRQKPHPPLWMACTNRESIARAARKGMGALTFAFIDPPEAKQFVDEYYDALEHEAVPVGYSVNPSIAQVTGFMCCQSEQEAIDKGLDGCHFFGYSLGHYYMFGQHRPAQTNIWDEFLVNRDAMGMSKEAVQATGEDISAKVRARSEGIDQASEDAGVKGAAESLRGAVGTPAQLRDWFQGFEEVGIDQVILIPQNGHTVHEDICAALELFAREVMPEFAERDRKLEAEKRARMAPVIDKVMARRPPDPEADPDYVIPAAAVF